MIYILQLGPIGSVPKLGNHPTNIWKKHIANTGSQPLTPSSLATSPSFNDKRLGAAEAAGRDWDVTIREMCWGQKTPYIWGYLGMVILPSMGNPCNGYINPYYWVDAFIPLFMERMGV